MKLSDNQKQLIILPAILLGITLIVICTGLTESRKDAELRIACSGDAAGIAIACASSRYGNEGIKVSFEDHSSVSFLQFADCCGNQAEIALAAGEFDMAVLCPDAAALFLASKEGERFVVAGGIIRDANVLVTGSDSPVETVGYMNGRELQKRALSENLGSGITYQPMMAVALPYALEVEAVDGVVLDAVNAVRSDGYRCIPLPYPQASSVLVVREDLVNTAPYARFLQAYNASVEELNGTELQVILKEFLQSNNSEEMADLWRTFGVTYLNIPNEEFPSAAL